MFNRKHLALFIAAAAGASAIAVLACGPDFWMQALDDRAGTLKSTPVNSFAFEVAHLMPVSDRLAARETDYDPFEAGTVEPPDSASATSGPGQPRDIALSAAQLDAIKAMRQAADGDQAYAVGDGLPMAVRLYTAGAVDYAAASPKSERIVPLAPLDMAQAARAQRRFQAVLALPAAEGGPRSVWAAYMLGQGYANAMQSANSDAEAKNRRADAIRAYALARTRANAGASDVQGLAVASFGEQARLYLRQDGTPCSYRDFINAAPCAEGIAPDDLKQAMHLYIEQAAHGSVSGLASLRYIAAWILDDEARIARMIDDPLAQRVLVAYALARVGDVAHDDPATALSFGEQPMGRTGYIDAARGEKSGRGGEDLKPNPILQSLAAALQRRGIDHVADADRLAALAYRIGRYDLAQALIDKQSSALSSWVRAKLALRRGDIAAAADAYAQASRAFPQADTSLEPASASLLKAEQGVLTLSRGQYVEALDQLYAAAASVDADLTRRSVYGEYSGDAFYVAERVLTTNELKNYVDANVRPSVPVLPPDIAAMTPAQRSDWMQLHPQKIADRLRLLLARKLVREERIAEALPYFPDDNDPRYIDSTLEDGKVTLATWRLRASARAYGAALDQARHAWRSATRAQGWYQAAVLARRRGMQIMGYEQSPDFAAFDGAFDYGIGRSRSVDAERETPQARAAQELPGPFVTDEERRRYAASESRPNFRYHYRDLAVDHITHAADLLPPRSQAFAAVLCKGAGFDFGEDASKLYRRYVKEGALVPFAKDFGAACAEPDFRAAARFPYVQAWRAAGRWLRDHRRGVFIAGAPALLLLAGGAIWLARRRRQPVQAR
ncbi:MAG TPA: hypothetical protein VGN04_14560 [Herbaspirillum sp.]